MRSHSIRFSQVSALTALVLAVFGVSAEAQAAAFKLLGGIDIMSNAYTPDPTGVTKTAGMGVSGGVGIEFRLGNTFGLEIGGIYQTRKGTLTAADGASLGQSGVTDLSLEQSYSGIQVPLLLRAHLGKVLSLGVGGYAFNGLGSVSSTVSATGVTAQSTTGTFAEAAVANFQYGGLASLEIAIPLGASAALLLDGRYALGLVNTSTDTSASAASIKTSDIQAFAGFRFGGGMK